jgi:hypothetical protein
VSKELDFEHVAPNASAMIESMRAYGYTLSTAIADLIDNCIAAKASRVWIQLHWSGADSWISVADDGTGMDEATLRDAMRLGTQSPLVDRDPDDLGRFGLGLKTASFSQCRRLTVLTRQAGGPGWIRRWDMDYLARTEEDGWRLLKTCAPGSEARLKLPEGTEQGTVVLWEELDRIVGNAEKDNKKIHEHFLKLSDSLERHLAMVFHRFLSGPGGGLEIQLNGVLVRRWDPFLTNHPATQKTPPDTKTLPGHSDPISIRGFILPHKDKLGEEGHKAASGPAGWNAQQGFYLYRNERLIIAGSWLGLGGVKPWTQEEHYKLARILVEIPNSMDHLWQLDVKKSSAVPPPAVSDWLRGLAQKVRNDARAVFAHRGRYGSRDKRVEYARPWKAVKKSGALTYRIDRNHPLIAALSAAVSNVAGEALQAVLRILEETVPVEQIWLDKAEQPDRFAGPFHGTTSRCLKDLIAISYRAIRSNRGGTHEQTIELLSSLEEFSGQEAQAIIGVLEKQP